MSGHYPYPDSRQIKALQMQQQQHNQNIQYNISPLTQGFFSSYPARIRQSQDNALLLPVSYITGKKQNLGETSDDDFEEMLEESEEEEEEQESSGRVTRRSTAAAAAAIVDAETKSLAAINEQNKNLPKQPHNKNLFFPNMFELERMSEITEVLVPVRLDIDLDEIKLRDVFVWNMNEQHLTPEMFAELLCEDLALDPSKFVKPISESIRTQVIDFEAIYEYELPSNGNQRVEINLDLQIGKVNLRDKFEWDLNNINTNAPEIFSRQLSAELGLGGEYVGIIAHGIRDQLFRHRKRMVEEYEGMDRRESNRLESAFRKVTEANKWAPKLEVLSNDELEKLLIAQERNIRRLRRETRFKRSSSSRRR